MNNVVKLKRAIGDEDYDPRNTSIKKATALDKRIGAAFRLQRIIKRVSMDKLGQALGITYQQVGKIEHGENRLHVSRLIETAEHLQFDAGAFINSLCNYSGDVGLDEQTKAMSEVQIILSSPGAVDLLEAFGRMPKKDQEILLSLATRMAKADF